MSTRYGVFLRPDPLTCLAVTTITTALRAQYGLVSAGAFPPHATLAGSLPLVADAGGADALQTLAAVLAAVAGRTEPFGVENAGVRLSDGVIYDIHNWDGAPNGPLVDLAADVAASVSPLLAEPAEGELAADIRPVDQWRGHLSLASHELQQRADLREEVYDFALRLALDAPLAFDAEVIALYRFEHPTWTADWWRHLTWQHLHSWRLGEAGGP